MTSPRCKTGTHPSDECPEWLEELPAPIFQEQQEGTTMTTTGGREPGQIRDGQPRAVSDHASANIAQLREAAEEAIAAAEAEQRLNALEGRGDGQRACERSFRTG